MASFLARGRELGGEEVAIGDAAMVLHPFPRVPMTFLLWQGMMSFRPGSGFFSMPPAGNSLPPMWSGPLP